MGVILEIKIGPMAGKAISLVTGQTVTFGRSATKSDFALPHDTFMSGLHFAVECGAQGCRVVDRKSSNGTFLNGAKIQDAMLANGDEIKSGATIFTVKMVADAKLAPLTPPSDVPPTRDTPQQQAVPEVPRPVRPPAAEPSALPPAMRTSEPSKDLLDSALSPAAPSQPAADRVAPRAAPSEPPAPGERPPRLPEPPLSSASPREEPPRVRAIPRPPVTPPNPNLAAPSVPAQVAPNPEASAPRPPAAQRPADRPAERGVPLSAGASREAAFRVMGWSFPAAPPEWLVQEGFGLQQTGHEEFPSSVAATEEALGGITLPQFVESQISMLRGYLRDAKIEPTMPPRISGAEESMAVDVRHSTKDGRELVYRRIYARSGSSVGVLTVTTLADELPQVLRSLQPLLDGAAFYSTVNN
jgi:hypothetical protein